MHLADYPALPPPTNALARAALAQFSVRAITFGSPLNNDLLDQVRVEYKLRKFYHSLRMISDGELLQARLRWTALLNEYAVAMYPPTPESTFDLIYRLCGELEDENVSMPSFAAIRADQAALRRHLDEAFERTEPPLKKEKTEERQRK